MPNLIKIEIAVNTETQEFVSATSTWNVSGKVEGYNASTSVQGSVVAKPITDALKAVIVEVIAQGPPAPPAE